MTQAMLKVAAREITGWRTLATLVRPFFVYAAMIFMTLFSRQTLLSGLLLAVLTAAAPNTASAGVLAYVSQDGSVAVIDTATNAVTATISIGGEVTGVAISPDGRFGYVCSTSGVSVINTSSNMVTRTISVSGFPEDIAFTPDGTRAYVTSNDSNLVWVINTATSTVVGTPISVGSTRASFTPSVAITPDGAFAYVVNYAVNRNPTNGDDNGAASVSVIDTSSNAVTNTVPIGNAPGGIAITSDGKFAYVANQCGNGACGSTTGTPPSTGTVSVIDTESRVVVETIPIGQYDSQFVTIAPDGRHAYVANSCGNAPPPCLSFGGTVSVVDTKTNSVIGPPIPVGAAPGGLAVTPDGSLLYVVNQCGSDPPCNSGSVHGAQGSVSVIDTATDLVVATVATGTHPAFLALASVPATSTDTPTCPCDCNSDGQVSVDEILTMVNMDLGNGGSCPKGMPAGTTVDVSLILSAVHNALNGCPALPLGTCVQNPSLVCNSDADCNPFPGGACTMPIPTPTENPTATGTPGANDCCQCPSSCAAPVDGTCGGCNLVAGAACDGDLLCVLHTPTPTPTVCVQVDNGDGTITDRCTGLMWEKKDQAGGLHDYGIAYAWGGRCSDDATRCQPNAAAAGACAAQTDGAVGCSQCARGTCIVDSDNGIGSNLGPRTTIWDWLSQLNAAGFAGHSDWRIPTVGQDGGTAELETILAAPYPHCMSSPCVPPAFSVDCTPDCTATNCSCTQSNAYWSATSAVVWAELQGVFLPLPGAEWVVYFGNPSGYLDYRDETYSAYARAVHGGT